MKNSVAGTPDGMPPVISDEQALSQNVIVSSPQYGEKYNLFLRFFRYRTPWLRYLVSYLFETSRNKASIIFCDTAICICCSTNFKYGVELCSYILSLSDGISLLPYLVSIWCKFFCTDKKRLHQSTYEHPRTAYFDSCPSYSHNHSQFQETHQRRKDLLVVVLSVRRLRHLCSSTYFHQEPEYDCHLFLSHHRHLHHPVPRKVRHSDEGTLEQHATPTTPSDFHLPARRFCVAVRFRCAVKPKKHTS